MAKRVSRCSASDICSQPQAGILPRSSTTQLSHGCEQQSNSRRRINAVAEQSKVEAKDVDAAAEGGGGGRRGCGGVPVEVEVDSSAETGCRLAWRLGGRQFPRRHRSGCGSLRGRSG